MCRAEGVCVGGGGVCRAKGVCKAKGVCRGGGCRVGSVRA